MISENLRREVNYYMECMANSYIGCTGKDIEDIIYDFDFTDQVQQDLEQVGFTSDEASEIYTGTYSKDITKYKMLAYCYLRYNGFKTIEELKTIIRSDSDESKLEDFTEEELNKILEAKSQIDY